MRFLIANLIHLERTDVSLTNLGTLVPDIYYKSNPELLDLPRPRILKSHQSFAPKYPRVIYIVRDPRDVAVSYYNYSIKVKKITEDEPIEQWIESFITGRCAGVEFYNQIGTWAENVGSWLGAKSSSEDFLLLKYEDLLKDGLTSMRAVSSFLNVFADDEQLAKVIELSSANHMREQEKKTGWQPKGKDIRSDISFFRTARSSNWQAEIVKEAVAKIETAWQGLMEKLGYLT